MNGRAACPSDALGGRSRGAIGGAPAVFPAKGGETWKKSGSKSYPPGIPAEIDVDEFRSLGDLFERSVARYADKPAYHCMGKSITYAELDALSARFGAWLQSELKLPERRARGADDAQRAAVPDRALRHAARGLHGGQRQPALHRARARAPAEGLRRRGRS
jgi:hypothetical protein